MLQEIRRAPTSARAAQPIYRRTWILSLVAAILLAPLAIARASAQQPRRPAVVISDLHMGVGRDGQGRWSPNEDFRWPAALRAFLAKVSAEGNGAVDLVIAGDFLELWQRPQPCRGGGVADLQGACTVEEMVELAERVVAGHRQELEDLARFAATGRNCVIVVPGNHDSALVLDPVWLPVRTVLAAAGGCVRRADDGRWSSSSGSITVEHGHQIGADANKYPTWPSITRTVAGRVYVTQPWGESFVQKIFNAEEAQYPLIDNLSPMSAGVRYRMADRGLVGTAVDVARFLRFNLADTSLRQKRQILGSRPADGERSWDRTRARGLGHRLLLEALPADDPFRVLALSGGEEWAAARSALDAMVGELTDDEVDALCDQLAIRNASAGCQAANLGAGYESLLYSRKEVMESHLRELLRARSTMTAFVYGHTHTFETPWNVTVRPDGRLASTIRVANSGAFQRLIDDDRLVAMARSAGVSAAEFLRSRTPESLPACYTSVHVGWRRGRPQLETRAWLMEESDPGGRFVDPCGGQCPNVGHGCDR